MFKKVPTSVKGLTIALALLMSPAITHAQTEGRVSVGGSVTFISPTDDDVKSTVGIGPLVRLNPKKGWGPAGALNWFRADLVNPAGGDDSFAQLRVRPLMVGVAYTVGRPKTLVSFSIVVGPSFNSVEFDDDFVQVGATAIDVENSFVVRPGVNITQTVAPRIGIVAFGGYMFNRPDITYQNAAGEQFVNRWRADAIVLSVGMVYSLF